MRWLWVGLSVVWCSLGWTQVGPGVLGPFVGTLDAGRRFALDTPLTWRVTGELADWKEVVPPGARVEIYLEPRPGLAEIVGIGNVEAIWVVIPGLDPVRITGFSIVFEPRVGFDLGPFTAPASVPCTDCTSQIWVIGDDGSIVQFWYRHCSGGRWGAWQLLRAGRGGSLPAEGAPECTWFALVTETKGQLSYALYHSNGRTWTERATLAIAVVAVRPVGCEVCQYVVVDEGGAHRTLYHCERPGVWKLIGEWGRPEPPPVRRVPPPPPPMP